MKPNFKQGLWLLAIAVLILANLIVWILVLNSRDKQLLVTFYNVGQGDSTLIQTPGGYNILIDGGPNNKISSYLNSDLPLNDREIDLLLLTHPQKDHLYGLIEVVRNFKVKRILTSNSSATISDYKLWIDTVENNGLSLDYVAAGQSIVLPDQVVLSFNWPESSQTLEVDDLNKASVVFTLSYGDFDLLMPGDADSQVQPYREASREVEVLKVPHHGSKTALKEEYLVKLKPKVSIISSGKNNTYGHPRPELLKMLAEVRSKVWRTDTQGSIKIVSDGRKWYTQTEK